MIRHALIDADGVLQDLPGGWVAALEPFVGKRAGEFLGETVVGARAVGLRAMHWRHDDGLDRLVAGAAALGLSVRRPSLSACDASTTRTSPAQSSASAT